MIGAQLAVIIVVFVTLFAASAYFMEYYFHRAKRRELIGNATKLAANLARFPELGESLSARAVLETFQEFTGTKVWVIDPDGTILMAYPDSPAQVEQVLKTLSPLEEDETNDPEEGPVSYVSNDPVTGNPRQSVALPIVRENGVVAGTVYVHAPLIGVRTTIRGVRQLLLSAGLIALVMAAIVSYWTARRIASPLTTMHRVVQRMAAGDWAGRVDVATDDELGRLGEAFNTMAGQLEATILQLSKEKRNTEAIVQSIIDGVLFVDDEGLVGLANAGAAPVLQVPPEEVIGQPVEAAVVSAEVAAAFRAVIASDEAKEDTLVYDDKTYTVHISPVSDDAGRAWGAVGLFHDTSEQARLEAMRREFVADVSHELRTPLTSIRGFLEAISDGVPRNREEAEEYVRIAASETERLQRLAETLLDVSSMAAGGSPLRAAPLPLAATVQDTVNKVLPQASGRDVTVEVHISEDMPAVFADSDKVDQILLNLLDNALRYSPEGGTIRVRARRRDDAVEVAVQDEGPGIAPEHQPYVWDRFYKVDKARSREAGSGLGLVIVKQLVELHGGTVGLESEPGRGSTFTFTLPVAGVG